MKKVCPHCGKSFVCRNHDILNCDCLLVNLTDADLHVHYPDECLCIDCLKLINQQINNQQ